MPLSCLPAKHFDWIDRGHGLVGPGQEAQSGVWAAASGGGTEIITGDFNGDGRTDVLRSGKVTCLSQGNSFSCNDTARALDNGNATPIVADFNGDGRDDYLTRDGDNKWRRCRSTGGSSIFICQLTNEFENGNLMVGDFDGDGRSDIYQVQPRLFYFGNADAEFQDKGIGLLLDENYFDTSENSNRNVGEFKQVHVMDINGCLLYTSPSPRDGLLSRMPSSA